MPIHVYLLLIFLTACSSLNKKALTQDEIELLTDKILFVSANGFICEKEGASFNESLVEVTCSKLKKGFQGNKFDRKLVDKFSSSASGPFLFEFSQQIDGVVITYEPVTGCLYFRKEKTAWYYDKNGKRHESKDPYKRSCPLISEHLERHPMGFIMFKKNKSSSSQNEN